MCLNWTLNWNFISPHMLKSQKEFPASLGVLIPCVQPPSPSSKRDKGAKITMINERRSPLLWIHLQELHHWSREEAAEQGAQYFSNIKYGERE